MLGSPGRGRAFNWARAHFCGLGLVSVMRVPGRSGEGGALLAVTQPAIAGANARTPINPKRSTAPPPCRGKSYRTTASCVDAGNSPSSGAGETAEDRPAPRRFVRRRRRLRTANVLDQAGEQATPVGAAHRGL